MDYDQAGPAQWATKGNGVSLQGIGATMAPTPPRGSIERELEVTGKIAEHLHVALSGLENRLAAIAPSMPEPASQNAEGRAPVQSPLGERIQSVNLSLASLGQRIEKLTARIDL